jgi:hypothetical protein
MKLSHQNHCLGGKHSTNRRDRNKQRRHPANHHAPNSLPNFLPSDYDSMNHERILETHKSEDDSVTSYESMLSIGGGREKKQQRKQVKGIKFFPPFSSLVGPLEDESFVLPTSAVLKSKSSRGKRGKQSTAVSKTTHEISSQHQLNHRVQSNDSLDHLEDERFTQAFVWLEEDDAPTTISNHEKASQEDDIILTLSKQLSSWNGGGHRLSYQHIISRRKAHLAHEDDINKTIESLTLADHILDVEEKKDNRSPLNTSHSSRVEFKKSPKSDPPSSSRRYTRHYHRHYRRIMEANESDLEDIEAALDYFENAFKDPIDMSLMQGFKKLQDSIERSKPKLGDDLSSSISSDFEDSFHTEDFIGITPIEASSSDEEDASDDSVYTSDSDDDDQKGLKRAIPSLFEMDMTNNESEKNDSMNSWPYSETKDLKWMDGPVAFSARKQKKMTSNSFLPGSKKDHLQSPDKILTEDIARVDEKVLEKRKLKKEKAEKRRLAKEQRRAERKKARQERDEARYNVKELNHKMYEFIRNPNIMTYPLLRIGKRNKGHARTLAKVYGLKTRCSGGGKRSDLILIKTKHSSLPSKYDLQIVMDRLMVFESQCLKKSPLIHQGKSYLSKTPTNIPGCKFICDGSSQSIHFDQKMI